MIRSFFKAKARFPLFSVSDLDIMRAAIPNNRRDGITGFLLRDKNTYLNVVEGPQDKIEAMLGRVAADPRAYGFQVLSMTQTQVRHYPTWAMGYHEHQSGHVKPCPIGPFLSDRGGLSTEAAMLAMQKLGLRQIKKDQRIAAI